MGGPRPEQAAACLLLVPTLLHQSEQTTGAVSVANSANLAAAVIGGLTLVSGWLGRREQRDRDSSGVDPGSGGKRRTGRRLKKVGAA